MPSIFVDGFFHLRVEGHLRLSGLAGPSPPTAVSKSSAITVPAGAVVSTMGQPALRQMTSPRPILSPLFFEVHQLTPPRLNLRSRICIGQLRVALEGSSRPRGSRRRQGYAVQQVVALTISLRRNTATASTRQLRSSDDHVFCRELTPSLQRSRPAGVTNVLFSQ